jgi:hypothetical protein
LIDTDTWNALLRYRPAYVKWNAPKPKHGRHAAIARAATAAGLAAGQPPPKSATAPDNGNELPGAPGRGRP